jgi:ferrous iron transport protein A
LQGKITLHKLRVGESGRVNVLAAKGIQRRRLLDLGFVPGVLVKTERISPFGDPIAFQIRGTVIALRKEETALIYVTKNFEEKLPAPHFVSVSECHSFTQAGGV